MSKYFKNIEDNMNVDFLAKLERQENMLIYLLLLILLIEVQNIRYQLKILLQAI